MFHVSYTNQMHIFIKANKCTKLYARNLITQKQPTCFMVYGLCFMVANAAIIIVNLWNLI